MILDHLNLTWVRAIPFEKLVGGVSDAPKRMLRGGLGMVPISLRDALQIRPISLRVVSQLDHSTIAGWSIFSTHPSFMGFFLCNH